jgi:uncharacterized repeat protein (TIGR03803 family)
MNTPITAAAGDWTDPQGFIGHRFSRLRQVTRAALRSAVPILFCAALATSASAQTEQVIFNLSFDKTGWEPNENGYTLVEPNGDVIGTAQFGGTNQKGEGVVFKASPPTKKNPNWDYKVIHRFTGGATGEADGENPSNGVTLGNDGILYGMTQAGGGAGCGVVYQMTPPAQSPTGEWEETVIHEFQTTSSSDGCGPSNAQLLFDANTGSLYGTTIYGGIAGSLGYEAYGTLFRLDPPTQAGGNWTETILYAFTGGSDGAYPSGGLAGDPDGGTLYGTAQNGGSAGVGVVWGYSTSTQQMTTIYTFLGGSDGAMPQGGVIGPFPYSVLGNDYYLLGTTAAGGGSTNCYLFSNGVDAPGCGTVFAINLSLTSQGQTITETQLHAYSGTDGAAPLSGLTRAGGGAWGTTTQGGPGWGTSSGNCATYGCGVLYEIQISGITHYTLSYVSVYDFQGSPNDGSAPATGLAAASTGNLYGMTAAGGTNDLDGGAGTLFEFVP